MSEILNCERRISLKLAKRVAESLELDPQERAGLMSVFLESGKLGARHRILKTKVPKYTRLSVDQFRLIGDWYHYAILTFIKCRDFKSDRTWIAKRLGLSKSTLVAAIERLKRVGAVKESKNGWLSCSETPFMTSDDIANPSIKTAHRQYLNKAHEALDNLPHHERDFTSLMLSFGPDQMARAKEMIRQFQDDFSAEFEANPQPEVYQLCIQLFPLTQKVQEQK